MSTELATQPFQYEPSVGENNLYVDRDPPRSTFTRGVRCGCGSTTLFQSLSNFKQHRGTGIHVKWMETLNNNKNNHLTELLQLRDIVKQQQVLIAERDKKIIELEQKIHCRETTIKTLSSILSNPSNLPAEEPVNLLD